MFLCNLRRYCAVTRAGKGMRHWVISHLIARSSNRFPFQKVQFVVSTCTTVPWRDAPLFLSTDLLVLRPASFSSFLPSSGGGGRGTDYVVRRRKGLIFLLQVPPEE